MVTPPSPNVRRGLVSAAIVCGYVAVTELLLQPLYVRGVGQGWISHATSLSGALSMPGLMIVVMPGLRQEPGGRPSRLRNRR